MGEELVEATFPAKVQFVFTVLTIYHKPRPWLDVHCSYCGGRGSWNHMGFDTSVKLSRRRICLMCRDKVQQLEDLLADPDFMGLWAWAKSHNWFGAVADWLGEHRHCELETALRNGVAAGMAIARPQ